MGNKYILRDRFVGIVIAGINNSVVFNDNNIVTSGAATPSSAPGSNLGKIYDVSDWHTGLSLEWSASEVDVTTFGSDGFRQTLPGEQTWSVSLDGMASDDPNENVASLVAYVALTKAITDKRIGIIIANAGTVNTTSGLPDLEATGQQIFFGLVTPQSANLVSGTVNNPATFSVPLQGSRELAIGNPIAAWDVSHANHVFKPDTAANNITSTA